MRRFNIAGPCRPDDHYMIPAERRLGTIRRLIDDKAYFVVHAPRQTGKTTGFLGLAQHLTAEGRYTAVVVSAEVGAWVTGDPGQAEDAILDAWRGACRSRLPAELQPPPWPDAPSGRKIATALEAWARASSRPLVVFLDEIDSLQSSSLISILRQLRDGYPNRPGGFPWAMALIGLRDAGRAGVGTAREGRGPAGPVAAGDARPDRDYLIQAGSRLGSSSPFNIKEASITLRNFTAGEVVELYGQHTAETGQVFTPEAVSRAFALSQGQPWLVNALAREVVLEMEVPPSEAITAAHIDQAKDRIILARATHLDSLQKRLREPGVAPIVAATLLGDVPNRVNYASDDFQYVLDLGLLRIGPAGAEAANPIYQEILGRELSYNFQMALPAPWWKWQKPDGKLDMGALLAAFLKWWRENSEILYESEQVPYREAAAHLALMGFLQRVVNGGGRVQREYAAARGRVDLVIEYAGERFVLELKRIPPEHRSAEQIEEEGIAQLSGYLETLGLTEGWLVIFDQRKRRTWAKRLWRKEIEVDGRRLHLIGA